MSQSRTYPPPPPETASAAELAAALHGLQSNLASLKQQRDAYEETAINESLTADARKSAVDASTDLQCDIGHYRVRLTEVQAMLGRAKQREAQAELARLNEALRVEEQTLADAEAKLTEIRQRIDAEVAPLQRTVDAAKSARADLSTRIQSLTRRM